MGKVFTIANGLENMGPLRTGGQGSVYKGRRTGEIFSAVKLLPTPICPGNDDDKNFSDFKNEVLKLKKVNAEPNPHVVKILNSGLTDSGGFPFIEMEYIDGPDLEELIKSPHDPVFSIKEVIKLADQLAGALAHCHKAGIKHGDIKSNNVKLNIDSGNYVLLDFGLAIMSDEQRRTSLRYAGAIEFMAPEQSDGIMLFESDVYGFGIVLYELLAGRVPFPLLGSGETARNSVMISHLETPVPDVVALRKQNLPETWTDEKKQIEMQVPGWLLSVISKCLEKKPENRYKNGIELYEAITINRMLPEKDHSEVNAAVLQQENERLHSLIVHHKQSLNDRDLEISSVRKMILAVDLEIDNLKEDSQPYSSRRGLYVPKAAFLVFLIAFFAVSVLTGYSMFFRKAHRNVSSVPQRDSAVIAEKVPVVKQVSLTDSISDAGEKSVKDEKVAANRKTVQTPKRDVLSDRESRRLRRKQLREEKQDEKVEKKKGKFFEVKFY